MIIVENVTIFFDDLNTGKRKCNILERFAFVFEDFS